MPFSILKGQNFIDIFKYTQTSKPLSFEKNKIFTISKFENMYELKIRFTNISLDDSDFLTIKGLPLRNNVKDTINNFSYCLTVFVVNEENRFLNKNDTIFLNEYKTLYNKLFYRPGQTPYVYKEGAEIEFYYCPNIGDWSLSPFSIKVNLKKDDYVYFYDYVTGDILEYDLKLFRKLKNIVNN